MAPGHIQTRLELSDKDYIEIKKYCKKIKIDLIITPWDDVSAKFINKLNIKAFKIASIDANNYQFCEFIAKMKTNDYQYWNVFI